MLKKLFNFLLAFLKGARKDDTDEMDEIAKRKSARKDDMEDVSEIAKRKSARKDDMDEVDEMAKRKSAPTDDMEDVDKMAKRKTPRKDDMGGVVDENNLDHTGDVKMAVWYLYRRDKFRNDPKAMEELSKWLLQREDYTYTVLTGLIPSRIVGIKRDFKKQFVKSDTWFSEFPDHNVDDLMLSTSDESYIIGNLASYDRRQYPQWFLHPDDPTKAIQLSSSPASSDPNVLLSSSDGQGPGGPEGQAFGHFLVITKVRIFNIVDPQATQDHCKVIRELRLHFIHFWNEKGGREKLLNRTLKGFEDQNDKLKGKLESALISSPSSPSIIRPETRELTAKKEALFESLKRVLKEGYDDMARQFLELQAPEDFVFGFHPFRYNSVGHLHLHVYPRKAGLREWSSWEHDWKTVEFETVLEAEGETLEEDMGG